MERSTIREIEEGIRVILAEKLDIPRAAVEAIDSNTPLLGRGVGLDSMEALTLATSLEERFGIRVVDDELTEDLFGSLGTLAVFVARKLEPHPNPGDVAFPTE
jgi:acyl carrier protein